MTSEKRTHSVSRNTMLRALVFFLVVFGSKQGRILPGKEIPIEISELNAGSKADYTFWLTLDNDLEKEGYLLVIFPSQYESYLGTDDFFQKGNTRRMSHQVIQNQIWLSANLIKQNIYIFILFKF